jgi:hypothetical protein
MKKWDYKIIESPRNYKVLNNPGKLSRDIEDTLLDLGDEGWELVTVVTRTSFASITNTGFSSEEMWVFKRPLEE